MKKSFPLLVLFAASAVADPLVSYTGTFTETAHPTISGAKVVTLTTDGTLSVPDDVRLLRVLVVGGGGGGGFGGGGGGQVVDWTPDEPVFLKSDDRYTAVVGYGGFRSYQTGSWENRGHNGHSSSFSCAAFSIVAFGGGGGLAFNNGNGRWDPEEPSAYGNGGGGSGGRDSSFSTAGSPAGTNGCHAGGAAANYSSAATGCGGAGGGAGAGGAGGDSQVLHNLVNDDDWQDENGNYEHAGDGGPGVESDITGVATFYGGGGGGGVRRSVYKHGGAGGAGGGGRGAGLFNGSFTESTAGTDGLGGGGGGGGTKAYGSNQSSSQGGCGVVILLVAPSAAGEEPADRDSPRMRGGTAKTWRDPETKKTWAVHEFRGNGTLEVSGGALDAELLLVGGGGSGGKGSASGGGAGGLVHSNSVRLARGTYTVVVGAGGASSRQNGGDTSLVSADGTFSLVALGGGGGGGYWGNSSPYFPGLTGGSSGGSAWGAAAVAPTPGPDGNLQGFSGGSAVSSNPNSDYPGGSGGGGAGGPGQDGAKNVIGNGGPGLSFDITGETRWYAGGGGGGYSTSANGNGRKGLGGSGVGGDGECAFQYTSFRRWVGHPGLDGTGSGGGGGGQGASTGGRGGCGVLIVRYEVPLQGTVLLVK